MHAERFVIMTYDKTIQYLYDSQPVFHMVGASAYKPGFDNMLRMMNAMGNPHKSLKCIHIAGTNGKGSTSHMIAAVLQSAGYKVGLYTSPHLVDYRERIRVNGKMIAKNAVVRFVEKHKELLEEIKPSFFETTTALAFDWFASQKVDIAVVEVGLGGRLDSTNIITPELSVITNIGMDHTEFLGDTLAKIAAEKAGIIKEGIPVVVGETTDETMPVFKGIAEEKHSQIFFPKERQKCPDCQLKGTYQQKNIRTVLCAMEVLQGRGWRILEESIANGLGHVCDLTGLQGRWQKISLHIKQPSKTSKDIEFILDTGHNSHGVTTYVKDLAKIDRLYVVFGMVNDKDVNLVLDLLPKHAKYYFTQAQTHRAIPAKELAKMGLESGLRGESYPTVKSAIEAAINEAATNDTIFIGGSNYVVGEALSLSMFQR